MKKIISILIVILILCCSLTACNNSDSGNTSTGSSNNTQSAIQSTVGTTSTQKSNVGTASTTTSTGTTNSNSTTNNPTSTPTSTSTQTSTNNQTSAATSTGTSVPTDPVGPTVTLPTSGTSLNANDVTLGALETELVVGKYTICAGNSQGVVVDAPLTEASTPSIKTCGTMSFTRRIKCSTIDSGSKQGSIAFKVTGATTVYYLAMSSSSTANRRVVILNESGKAVATSTGYAQLNGSELIPASLSVTDAGTYYMGSPDGGVNFYYVIIDSSVLDNAPVTPTVPTTGKTLKTDSSLTLSGVITAETACGTTGFTLMAGAGTDPVSGSQNQTIEIDNNKKTSGTYSFTKRIKLCGAMNTTTKIRSIKFTTNGPATITYCAMSSSGSDTTRKISIINESGEVVAESVGGAQAANSEIPPRTLTVSAAGTYYIGSLVNGVNFYLINVSE